MSGEFYGDNLRWFLGVVEDNKDPLKLGRVRVRVRGIHSESQEDIQTSDLPWSQVTIPSTEGGVSGTGTNPTIQPGAEVMGFFFDGEASQLPVVIGSIPKLEFASSIQRANYDKDGLNRLNQAPSVGGGTGVTGEANKIRPQTDEGFGAQGNTNPEIAFNFFLEYGFTPKQAAGIVGNLQQES